MFTGRHPRLVIFAVVILLLNLVVAAGVHQSRDDFDRAWGPAYKSRPHIHGSSQVFLQTKKSSRRMLQRWNHIAIDASGLDHTPVAPGENRVFGEQLGPCRASRAMAIVHIAIFDAGDAIAGGYESYTGLAPAQNGTSMDAAVAQAAHDTLAAMFPSQTPTFDQLL